MIDWQPRAKEYAAGLADAGVITDPAWLAAFEATPRHLFTPTFWALDQFNAPDHIVDGADPDQRDEWLTAVYSDQFLATQVTDGMITSSASLPSLVAAMLHLLNVQDGHRVLEIGTGTGYNTALLCQRLGDRNVASVDIDPTLVDAARERLEQIGEQPLIVAGDGVAGLPDAAPYDRILSTCASPGVPAAWIDQLAEGGTIVAPFTFGGALAVATKTGPSEVTGRFDAEPAWFMPLRPVDRLVSDGVLVDMPNQPSEPVAHHGTTEIELDALSDPDFRLWLVLHLPYAKLAEWVDETTMRPAGLVVYTAEHRATADYTNGSGCVMQDSRRLWDTVEAAWLAWNRHGRPDRTRLGITARADGVQRAWLHTPDSGVSWPIGPLPTRVTV